MPQSQPEGGSPKPADLIKSSYAPIGPRAGEMVDRFFERLFETAPGLRGQFPSDMSVLKRHLQAALGLVVRDAHRIDVLSVPLREVGRKHVGPGATHEHYVAMRELMLSTLAEFAGEAWSAEAAGAWKEALNRVAELMLEGVVRGAKRAA